MKKPVEKSKAYKVTAINLLILTTVSIGFFLSVTHLDLFERLYHFTREHEDWELDEIIILILGVLIAGSMLAVLRSFQLRKTIKNLEAAQSELAEAQAFKNQNERLASIGEIAGGMAHEINNALQPAIGMTDILKRRLEKIDPALCEFVDMIHDSSVQAKNIIQHVLSFARCNYMTMSFMKLEDALEDCMKNIIPVIPDDITFNIEMGNVLERKPQPYISVNQGGLEQVLSNIIENACEAMNGKGEITFRTEFIDLGDKEAEQKGLKPGVYTNITIIDTGPGIEEAMLEKSFEPFVSTKASQHGTGLGLATAYGIIQQFEGTIRATSVVGEGSRFCVLLPILTEDDKLKTDEPEEALFHV